MTLWQILILLAAPLAVLGTSSKDQKWSFHVYKDKPFTLHCKTDTTIPSTGDVVTWQRHGHEGNLVTNTYYSLLPQQNVAGVDLRIHKVTDDMQGIYVCHIHNSANQLVESVVWGLNVGPHKYEDDIDKYGEKVETGAIAGACVFAFIVAVGLISQFRYLDEESKEKRRQRKEQRLNLHHNNAYDNSVVMTEVM